MQLVYFFLIDKCIREITMIRISQFQRQTSSGGQGGC